MKKYSVNMFQVPPLMVFEYQGDMNNLLEHFSNIEYVQSSANLKSKDDYVLDDDNLKELKQFCLDSVHEYVNDVIGNTNDEIGIQQSWVNVNKPNQSHPQHHHSNSFISGVFYLSSDQEKGSPIIFQSDVHKNNFFVNILPKHRNDKFYPSTASNFTYPSIPGQLILFSSTTSHFVPANNSDVDRISLSFNTFPHPPFGNKEGLTYLR